MKKRRVGRILPRAKGGGYLVTLSHLWKLARAWMNEREIEHHNGPHPL